MDDAEFKLKRRIVYRIWYIDDKNIVRDKILTIIDASSQLITFFNLKHSKRELIPISRIIRGEEISDIENKPSIGDGLFCETK